MIQRNALLKVPAQLILAPRFHHSRYFSLCKSEVLEAYYTLSGKVEPFAMDKKKKRVDAERIYHPTFHHHKMTDTQKLLINENLQVRGFHSIFFSPIHQLYSPFFIL